MIHHYMSRIVTIKIVHIMKELAIVESSTPIADVSYEYMVLQDDNWGSLAWQC